MPKIITKFLFSSLAFLVVFLSFTPALLTVSAKEPPPVKDSETWYNQSFKTWYSKVIDPTNPSDIFGERYTAAQVQWVIYGLFAFIINQGTGPENAKLVQCFLDNATDIDKCAQELSKLVSSLNEYSIANSSNNQSLASLVFADRPMSGVSYVKEKINTFNLVPVANAQTSGPGFGFDALEPVQAMWKGVRDVSYGLFVLTTVIFAFMIMFRVKISPQLVISVQSALPKIFGALILTTFSFAIAGFLIDLMYVVIGILSVIGTNLVPFNIEASRIFNFLTTGSPGGVIPLGIIVTLSIYMVLFTISFLALLMISMGGIYTGLGTIATGAVVAAGLTYALPATLLISFLVLAIVIIMIAWHIIKIIWALTKAFVNILLLTIFAPLQFTLGVLIPNFGFGAWIKSYAAGLSTFVVTGVLMLLSFVFMINGVALGFKDVVDDGFLGIITNAFFGTVATGAIVKGGTSFSWPPLLGSGNSGSGVGLLYLGVSFVLFTLIPKATEIVAGFITGKPFAYGSAIGEAFAPVGAVYNRTLGPGVGAFQKYGSEKLTVDLLTSLNKEMTSGRLKWVPQGIKDFVDAGAKGSPQPFH